MKVKRCVILIDGSNFYFKLKDFKLHHLIEFNFSRFNKMLVGNNNVTTSVYYVGRVRTDGTEKTQSLFNNQRKLFFHLGLHKVKYSLGYLLKSGGVFHEKGVDVQIAVDIVRGAIKNEYDICYLISSDTDLLPAIKTALNENKKIIYVGFHKSISKALMKNCSSSLILKKADLLPFTEKK